MHVSSCLHPVKIYNKYVNETMYVPCGKCAACANARAKRWIDRLNQESKCWQFTYNLYLDYDDEHVPTFDIVGEFLVEQQTRFHKNFTFDEICIPLKDLNFEHDYDFDYFVARCNEHRGIPHASVKDIQLFKKRLNKYLYKHVTGKYQNFRSAIVAEYGPTTFRGHYHGMLFFNDPRIAKHIQDAVSACWTFGHSNAEPPKSTKSAVAGYIAQYLNRPTHLPSFHAHHLLSPFFLTSRNPPIGTLLESSEEIRKIFFSGSCERVTTKVVDGKTQIRPVPLSQSLKARLYPKCPRYGVLTDACRTELYRCLLQENGEPYDTYECAHFALIRKFGLHYRAIENGVEKYECDFHSPLSNSWLYSFIRNITDNFENWASVLSLYRITKRIYYQSLVFGISYNDYLRRIYEFYQNYELYRLKQFYQWQNEYSLTYPVRDLVFAYPNYVDLYNRRRPLWLQEFLRLDDCLEFKLYKSFSNHLYEESHKRCKQNGYLERLKQRDPVLSSIINNFHYAKKCNENDEARPRFGSKRLRFKPQSSKHSELWRNNAFYALANRTRW